MEYAYQARDSNGVLRIGTVEAVNEPTALATLQQHGLIVIKILPSKKVSIFERTNLFERVSSKDVVLFSRQFATLINAKVPIVKALNILELQVSSNKLKTVVREISQRVESGDSLSSALARYPTIFPNLYISLVRAGELSGTMDESLGYLADQMEKEHDLRSKIIGSFTYPIFVVSVLIIVGFLMFLYVLPPLVSILRESNVDLPFTTKILIAVTDVMQRAWWLIILVLLGTGFGYRAYSRTAGGRYIIDAIILKLPIFGKLFQRIYMARLARNLSTLINGGIPIVKALESIADIVGNSVYRQIIMEAAEKVRNGKGIALALNEHAEFPPLVGQMIQIGETTGRLQDILEKLATFYDKEVEAELKILTTLLEPLIMVLLGLAVAVMVAGILLPIYNLASAS